MTSSRVLTVVRVLVVMAWAGFLVPTDVDGQPPSSDPSVETVVRRMADYVAAYGAQASVIVATETYTQLPQVGDAVQLGFERRPCGSACPRVLVAEFAIVKVADRVGWTGFRDVVQVDGTSVADRQDRLVALLTGPAGSEGELRRLSDESARYNVGVVIRNVNVPTTAMFFFHPQHVGRFSFRRAGTKTIDGVVTWAITFEETRKPTLVMKRDGTDVPAEGTVWVVPGDGTVVRTKLRLEGFAEFAQETSSTGVPPLGRQSVADIDVTYRRDPASGVWFPRTMDDTYRVFARDWVRGSPKYVHTVGRATYSNLRRFDTAVRIIVPQ